MWRHASVASLTSRKIPCTTVVPRHLHRERDGKRVCVKPAREVGLVYFAQQRRREQANVPALNSDLRTQLHVCKRRIEVFDCVAQKKRSQKKQYQVTGAGVFRAKRPRCARRQDGNLAVVHLAFKIISGKPRGESKRRTEVENYAVMIRYLRRQPVETMLHVQQAQV